MVDIKPYLEDDEGGDENWIPLNPRTSLQSSEHSDSAGAAAAVENVMMDNSGEEGAAKNDFPLTVDSEDDDEDEGWQKLSSSLTITEHRPQAAAAAPTISSLLDFLPALSSITKVTTVPTSEENDGVDSESEENIVWRRPNALDDTEIKHFKSDRERSVDVFEEYNDDKISINATDDNNALRRQRSIPSNKSQRCAKEDTSFSDGNNEESTRKLQEHPEQQQRRPQQQQRSPPSTRIKSKLQEKFIHDPLRSLPYHFLRNFFLEAKHQLTFAWKCYFINDDGNGSNDMTSIDTGVLAALILYSIIGLFGLGLILHGVYQIGLAILSTLLWSMEASVKTTRDGMCASIYTTLTLGVVIWLALRIKSRKWFEATFRCPTISTALPVVVAFTSPSVYEVFIIGLSVRTILSVCKTGLMTIGSQSVSSTIAVVIIAAAFSNFLVMNIVSWTELENEKNNIHSAQIKEKHFVECRHKTLRRMQTYPHECHALGIVTLAALSVALVLVRDGVFIFCSLRLVRICLSIGIGIFVLERLWDSILEAIAAKGNRGAAIRMSLRQISTKAMKTSLLDLSTSALWSKDDTGNVVLGILSEEDSELRYAILGWILDRWAATSNDQPAATANDPPPEENSPLNEPFPVEETKSSGVAENHPSRSDSALHAHRDDTKFDTKHDNNKSSTEAEFRSCSESDFRANDRRRPSNSSYQSLQSVITKLDADEALIPTINRYREWVYSLQPDLNLAFCVAMWKQSPAIAVFGLAIIWAVGRSVAQVIVFYTLGSTSADNIGNFHFVCIIAGALWPLLLIEYFSLCRWWTKHFKDQDEIPDSVIIMLESEEFSPKIFFYPIALATDTSALFLRVWKLLLESISFLESSVPAVRCATVACCTADLAVDTLCLVDLAFEVQKRGLIGGIGMLMWDAFNHHLKEELKQRRSTEGGDTNQHDGLDSKYTGAVINSARNIGKISQNIEGLMSSQKKDREGMKEKDAAVKSEDNCKQGGVAGEESSESPGNTNTDSSARNDDCLAEVSTDSFSHTQDDANEKEESRVQNEGGSTCAETKQTCIQEAESEVKMEQEKEGENLMPVLIGGGLAVLGALVGGITVAAVSNNKNDEKRRSRDADSR
jgi:hypothetical protein